MILTNVQLLITVGNMKRLPCSSFQNIDTVFWQLFYIACYSQLIFNQMCKCTFCKTYKKYKWAVVMECKCGCHDEDGMTGHDGLCCEFPNGLRKNNPYKKLKSAEYYRNIIQEWERSCDV